MNVLKDIANELKQAVGPKDVQTDLKTLEKYSKDQSFVRPCKPDFVVFAKSVEEVQEVVKIANKHRTPVVPFSSGNNFRGATIPFEGGIILNLSKMNKIIEINGRYRFAIVEPGVTYEQLQDELAKHGLRIMVPLGVPPKRSVLSSYMEIDPKLSDACYEYEYGGGCYDQEIVMPSGDVFKAGAWCAGKPPGPGGPALKINKFLQGAQGTFGIVTKLVVSVEHLQEIRKVFFIPFDTLANSIEPIRKIQRREVGTECFALNNFNLASILTEDWTVPDNFPSVKEPSTHFEALRKTLPSWTFIIGLSSLPYFPEDSVEYQEEYLKDACKEAGVLPLSTIPSVPESNSIVLEELLRPWRILKKFRYKGSCHNIPFRTMPKRVPEFEKAIQELAIKHRYPPSDIGGYVQVEERAFHSMYCEFEFYCDREDEDESKSVGKLWLEAIERVANMGGYLNRPYGPIANAVYSRCGTYTMYLKELKKQWDPNNILNPGKLCF